jgi:gas vesicle protein
MTVATETEVRELRELILGLREEMRIGFVQMDIKFVEFKSEVKGEIQRVESELKSEIQRVESELKSDIKRVESELKSDIKRVEAKTDVKLAELGGKIDVLDERTKVGFWGFIGRAVIIGIIGGGLAFGAKFLFTGRLTF